MQSRRRRVKIVATLGPASADRKTIAALFAAGADVFRINMSHASHDGMRERVAMIRDVEEETGRPIGILVDLQGPKLRLGTFANGAADLAARRGLRPSPTATPRPGPGARPSAGSGNLGKLAREGAPDPHRRRQESDAAGCRGRGGRGADRRREVPGRVSNKKGVSLPDTTDPDLRHDVRQGSRRPGMRRWRKTSIGSHSIRSAPGEEDVEEVKAIVNGRAAGDGQDRKSRRRSSASRRSWPLLTR